MFKRSMPMLDPVSFFFNEKVIVANKNDTVAAALLAAGITTFSLGTNEKTHRAPVCMIGNCFECLVEIDGQSNQQACLIEVSENMNVKTQYGLVLVKDLLESNMKNSKND